jgi:hypothetical protein
MSYFTFLYGHYWSPVFLSVATQDPTTGETHLRHHVTPDGYFKGRQIVVAEED